MSKRLNGCKTNGIYGETDMMWEGAGKSRFGICACRPEDSSFTAVFTDLRITECAWRAHDGQQPDEDPS